MANRPFAGTGCRFDMVGDGQEHLGRSQIEACLGFRDLAEEPSELAALRCIEAAHALEGIGQIRRKFLYLIA